MIKEFFFLFRVSGVWVVRSRCGTEKQLAGEVVLTRLLGKVSQRVS